MAENTNTEQVQNTEQTNEPQYSAVELEAIDQGWIPKDEFDGDPDKFIDAPEFIRRGELFKKIESQSKELKQVRQALEAFKTHHSKVKEAEYNRALKALNDARKQAFVDGEHEKAFAYEEQIESIKAEKDAVVRQATEPVSDPSEYTAQFQDWVGKNQWYETDELMRGAADTLGVKLHQQGLSPSEVLNEVEKRIRKEFAHKFSVNRNKPSPVEGSTRSGGNKSESFAMSDEEATIMKKIVNTGVMTKEQYIAELKRTR